MPSLHWSLVGTVLGGVLVGQELTSENENQVKDYP